MYYIFNCYINVNSIYSANSVNTYITNICKQCLHMKQQTKQVVKLTREDKALQLFQAGAVSKIRDDLYHVKSQNNPSVEYEVIPSMNVCACIDFERTGLPCKH